MKAFPYQHKNPTSGLTTESSGMDLRDYFAAMALSAIATQEICWTQELEEKLAKGCYQIADAMMKAREARNDNN